ncbi:nucleoid-associated protein [Caminicella sporogenes]|uniref:nucleoid-associated protein n=1 Tax=Caminicella sporogenes TaxID=166485 RepID=UPI00253F6750|nr:nucleoid-associated protein [Caminicella sporogenes]WIF94858.1 nucleoid-associated protein [Caminicella sporogenes]
MQDIESIIVERAIVHILDNNSDTPILGEIEQEIDEEIHEFLVKHIIKSLRDDDNRKAKFRLGKNSVIEACKEIFDNEENFIEASKKIANRMFRIMKTNNNISSCDLVVCIFSSNDSKYIGILKLDYQKSFVHEIEYIENYFKVSIIPQDIGLPGLNQKLQKCAFIRNLNDENDYDMIVLDKQNYSQDSEIARFFIDEFLNSEIIIDNKYKTKMLKKAVEKWTRKNLKEDLEKALEVREEVNNVLKNDIEVDIQKISENIFKDDESIREKFILNFEEQGIDPAQPFEIDKSWVNKKMNKKVIKTDTGFEIKGIFEDFDDMMKFNIKRNGDGTVDIIVKNVRSIVEK